MTLLDIWGIQVCVSFVVDEILGLLLRQKVSYFCGMYIRTRKRENGKVTILIAENVRRGSKVQQKTLRTVSTVFTEEVTRFTEIAEHIKTAMEAERTSNLFPFQTLSEMVISSRNRSFHDDSPLPVNLRTLREESRIVTDIHDIYGSLYDEIGFSRVMKTCPKSRPVVKDVVMARLAKPCSKRSTCELLERDFGISIGLEKIYRMLDTLTEDRIRYLLATFQRLVYRRNQGHVL